MDETISADTKSSTQSTATAGNVRVKISSWLSGIVDEVKKKAPTPLHPRVDVSPDESVTAGHKAESLSSIELKEGKESPEQSVKKEDNQSHEKESEVPESASTSEHFWKKTNFLNKFSKTSEKDKWSDHDENSAVSNLASLGKAKINEFYDKVRINKARYYILRNRKMEIVRMSNENLNSTLNENVENHENENLLKPVVVATETEIASSLDGNLNISNISNISDNFLNLNRKITIGEIGRSSTSETNPHESKTPNLKATKNISIGNIGRSFSEQNDDDDFLLNERSRNNTTKQSNVSSSLPSFFGNKSLSISPIAKQSPMSRETSLSESPRRSLLLRDSSLQSDSSHCSSVESLLEARRPDPEAILVNLGFGPIEPDDVITKIPKRFLKPSQVKGVDTEEFLRQQQLANHIYDHSVLGYRGLVGNPHFPPSTIVAKIMERFEMNERNRCIFDINMNRPQSAPPTPGPNS